MKRIIFTAIAILLFAGSGFAAEVKNVKAQQAGSRVLFEFDVIGDLSPNASIGDEGDADVSVTLTINGKTYTADNLHLEGDYGKVKVGNGKKIYWNVLQDFPRGLSTTFDWEIVAGGKLTIVLDNKTKLMWARDGNITGRNMNWNSAFQFVKQLNKQKYAGYSDWRLPTIEELKSLVNYANANGVTTRLQEFFNEIGFKNVQVNYYWSSTTSADGTGSAWSVGMGYGYVFISFDKTSNLYVLPVRAGQ